MGASEWASLGIMEGVFFDPLVGRQKMRTHAKHQKIFSQIDRVMRVFFKQNPKKNYLHKIASHSAKKKYTFWSIFCKHPNCQNPNLTQPLPQITLVGRH